MTTLITQPAPARASREVQADARPSLTAADLAELISSFNEVTTRLQGTHDSLRGEVARLEGELREAQGQLRRARQLAALGEMAAGIAHEVRNPLGSIRLYASALAQDLADRPAEQSLATKIGSAVSRLNAVVGDVLNFARELVVRPAPVAATEIVKDALEACEDLWETHGVTLRRPGASAAGIAIACDAGLIHQAMVNVLRNAAEAAGDRSDGGARRVSVDVERRMAVDSDGDRAPMVALIVRDTGPGVSAEAMSRLFNPFFTTRHTGTGLGLAIVHRIVDAHGGRVSIRNNAETTGGAEARGACVEILLPAAEVSQTEEEAPE